jgi:uncharacterized protein
VHSDAVSGLEPLVTTRPWVMGMTWLDLAFLHWRVPASSLERFIAPGLQLQTFDGDAWLGVVPFLMDDVRARGLPPIPGTHRFLELNVRTYVTDGSRPGVWFFSLDAENPLAVRAARAAFHLPYMDARMRLEHRGNTLEYRSLRSHRGEPSANFHARYAPTGEAFTTTAGSLEHWLTERYCLYSADRTGRVYRGEIRHVPWPLQPASVEILENTMAQPLGLDLNPRPDLVHFVAKLEVTAWLLTGVK